MGVLFWGEERQSVEENGWGWKGKVHQSMGMLPLERSFFFHASSLFGAQSSVSEVTHLFPGCLPSCAAVCLLFRPKRTLFFSPPPTHTHSQSILFILFCIYLSFYHKVYVFVTHRHIIVH